MNRIKYILLLLLLPFLFLCEKREWKNPYDPNILPADCALKNIQIEVIYEAEMELMWENRSIIDVGYIIERKVTDGNFVKIDSTIETFYQDRNISKINTYSYRIKAFVENIISNASNSSIIECVLDRLLWTGNHTYTVFSVNFSFDNSKVVSGSKDNTVKVWDSTTGNLI